MQTLSTASHSNASEIAAIYAALGDRDQAMAWLERGFRERFNPGVLLRPGFDPPDWRGINDDFMRRYLQDMDGPPDSKQRLWLQPLAADQRRAHLPVVMFGARSR